MHLLYSLAFHKIILMPIKSITYGHKKLYSVKLYSITLPMCVLFNILTPLVASSSIQNYSLMIVSVKILAFFLTPLPFLVPYTYTKYC